VLHVRAARDSRGTVCDRSRVVAKLACRAPLRSVNEVICHGIPDLRPLQEGDIVNLDISVYYDGFHSDLNETFFVGAVSERAQKLVNVARECLEKAIAMGMLRREESSLYLHGTLLTDVGINFLPFRGGLLSVVQ